MSTLAGSFVVGTVFVFAGKAESAQWFGYMQWLLPITIAAYGGLDVAEKYLLKK